MILDRIIAVKRRDLARERRRKPLSAFEDEICAAPPVRDFKAALTGGENLAVIAEHKRSSPSKGVIRADLPLPEVIKSYERGGAAALSILTEQHFFQGSSVDLKTARNLTDLPILRKDFIIDPYQVYEARALGADAVLLIVAALSDTQLAELLELTQQLGMQALVETHTPEELARALSAGAEIIGINNRNLRTFKTTLETTLRLAQAVPGERILVAESGIQSPADVGTLTGVGVDAVLVGERLMRAENLAQATRALASVPRRPSARKKKTQVKICGITSVEQGLTAAAAGADILGVVFAPSPKQVSLDLAAKLRAKLSQEYPQVKLAGVFVNTAPERVFSMAQAAGLDLVQLHGDETLADINTLAALRTGANRFEIIKAVPVHGETAIGNVCDYQDKVDGILLDTPSDSAVRGGTGRAFDWRWAALIRCQFPHLKLGLAGGLHPGNVRKALAIVNPDLVDVSSGVEAEDQKGVKDLQLVQKFIQQVRQGQTRPHRKEQVV
ncbi:MAG: indole-3-glycerol phosphate synthase TrpC [Firmicutes bacterium]|nr:indole-3-glycerol phosphate synthase TrpC [Bacillota bacterium]